MKAVIYARYSSDDQREGSIEGQIRECTAFAEKNGITILKHYIDRAYSAKTDNRLELQRMINDSMFINRIYLYDDKLVITFNHKDGAETTTLEDIETVLAEAGFGSDLVSFAVPNKRGWCYAAPSKKRVLFFYIAMFLPRECTVARYFFLRILKMQFL